MNSEIKWRSSLKKEDIQTVNGIVRSSGFFREDEIQVATELVKETLEFGKASGYEFLFAEINNVPIAYSCFGPIPCSLISWDLYWIATHQDFRNKGTGKLLLSETEKKIRELGGKSLYIETSSKEKYLPTQSFYLNNAYLLKAEFEDFYDTGDNKLVYCKKL